MRRRVNSELLVCLLLLLVSCREPLVRDRFLKGDGPYVFPLEMGDTTASYDFDLYTRIDDADSLPADLPLDMVWTSPLDSTFRETVYLPLVGKRRAFSLEIYAPYRAEMRPVVPGKWTLTVSVPDSARLREMRGLGLVMTKQKDGTR